VPGLLAERLVADPGRIRVAIDGPPCAQPELLAAALAAPLRALGRPFVQVRSDAFWRDASLRFEHGREDAQSYIDWLDAGALRREVLEGGDRYLPSLRDPATNRATRAERQPLADNAVLAVSGAFLLGLGLPFDHVVHLQMSAAARRRHTPPELAWTLAAFDTYDAEVCPVDLADTVIKVDDPAHPALLVQ
jgi:hypothetical protein